MPVLGRIGAAVARAYGLFKQAIGSAAGYLYYWGYNVYGNVGQNDITTTFTYTPTQIPGDNNIIEPQAAPGSYGAYAIKGTGTMWSWGRNLYGNIGDGTTTDRSSPVQIGTLNTWRKIGPHYHGAAAVKSDGTLWSWGRANYGQNGDDTTVDKSSPVQVGTTTDWENIFTTYFTAVGLKTDGSLWGFGRGTSGQLGNSQQINMSSPIQISADTGWAKVVESSQAILALKTNGTLWSWGLNSNGQLGQGDIISRSSPVQVGTLNTWDDIAPVSADGDFLAVKTDGTLWAWGGNNVGVLGVNNQTPYSSPIQVGTLTNWSKVGGGTFVASAVKTDGTLWAWGYNNSSQLGDGTTVWKSSPVQIGYQRYWKEPLSFSGTDSFAMWRTTHGELWGSGFNGNGQLGINSDADRSSPVQLGNVAGGFYINYWGNISTGLGNCTYGVKHDGTLWAWGLNAYGMLGINSALDRSSPTQIGSSGGWARGSAGNSHGLLIKATGELFAVGRGIEGGLGISSTINYSSPVQVGTQTNWLYATPGRNMSVAVKTNGSLWAWGRNDDGDLGNNSTVNTSSPVQIGALSTWEEPGTAFYFTQCARKKNGTIWTWAGNSYGTVGTSDTIRRSSPTQVGSLIWTSIRSGYYTMQAIRSDGTMWCWGLNNNGQLGNNGSSSVDASSPVQVSGGISNFAFQTNSIGAGYGTTSDNKLYWWGSPALGLSGDPSLTERRSSPVQVGTQTDWTYINGNEASFVNSIKTNGDVYAWGSNQDGFFGNGSSAFQTYYTPTKVGDENTWTSTTSSATGAASWGIKSDGTLWGWGINTYGALGLNDEIHRSSPTQVGTQTDWALVAGASAQTLAIKTNGSLWTWGRNVYGGLGQEDTVNRSSPVQVGALTNWSQVSGGQYNWNAVKTDGTLWACGLNGSGELGVNSQIDKSSPVQVGADTNWTYASFGLEYAAALKSDNTLWAWGDGANGATGLVTNADASSPVQVASDVAVVATSREAMAFIKTDGTLWVTGRNINGDLGLGDTIARSQPVQVGTLTNWSHVIGYSNFLAIKTDGTLWSWGRNNGGQVGDGTSESRSSPIQIGTLTSWNGTLGGAGGAFVASAISTT